MTEPIQGKIYGIYDKSTGELLYVGGTNTSLNRRLSSHISDTKRSNRNWSQHLDKINFNVEIRLLELYPCETKLQLRMREEEWRKKLNPPFNTLKAFRSTE